MDVDLPPTRVATGTLLMRAEQFVSRAREMLAIGNRELALQCLKLSEGYHEEFKERQRARWSSYLTRASLLNPAYSSWRQLKAARQDQAYLVYLGFDVKTFDLIAALMREECTARDPATYANNKKPLLWYDDITGLVLAWITSCAEAHHFQLAFGIGPGTMSKYLQWGLLCMFAALLKRPEYKPTLPANTVDLEKCRQLFVEAYPPSSPDIQYTAPGAMVVDGTTFPIPAPPNKEISNLYYSGYKNQHCCNNLFVFTPDGKIAAMWINYPGAWPDYHVATLGFFDAMEKYVAPLGYGCFGDSAFYSRRTESYMFTPLRKGQALPVPLAECARAVARSSWIVVNRQSAEWSIRTFKATFPRLLMARDMTTHHANRTKLIHLCALLFNLRAHHVGRNQMRSVFMPALRKRTHEMGYADLIWGEGAVSEAEAAAYDAAMGGAATGGAGRMEDVAAAI